MEYTSFENASDTFRKLLRDYNKTSSEMPKYLYRIVDKETLVGKNLKADDQTIGKETRPVDILGMDACLMSMVELAYQMRDVADYTVASEETEPGDGWPYHGILKSLAAKPDMTPEELSV